VARFRSATVTALLAERPGLQRVDTTEGRAYVLTQLTPPVAVGDEVVLNTTAVDLGLGTGGWHVVHWNLATRDWDGPSGGHIVKLRYTSLQVDAGAAEEHVGELLDEGAGGLAAALGGMPVVVCTLHSQAAVVAAVLRNLRPGATIAYVMTDGAALPIALSDVVAQLRDDGVLDATVTAGHAFGGDHEAVSVAGALVVARRHAGADVTVVGMGPGVVGTGTLLGTTAVEAAGIADTVAALGGRPVLCARVSDGDGRERHRGLSHHSATVAELVRTPGVPMPLPGEVDGVPDVAELLEAAGLRITTMGRGPAEDPAFFAACGAAATVAAGLLGG
jgi:hypothetical protein